MYVFLAVEHNQRTTAVVLMLVSSHCLQVVGLGLFALTLSMVEENFDEMES